MQLINQGAYTGKEITFIDMVKPKRKYEVFQK